MILLYPEFNMNVKLNGTINRLNLINPSTSNIEQYYQAKYEILQFDNMSLVSNDQCNENHNTPDTTTSYEIVNNKIYKIDKSTDYHEYQFSNEITFRLHNECDVVRKEIYTIPLDLSCVKKEFRKYKLHSTSLVTLMTETNAHTTSGHNNNNTKKIMFQVNETEITESIKEELITFLSLLKLYK